jgi:hypothetical protein
LLDIVAAADPNTILPNKELIQSLDIKKKRANEAVEKFQAHIQEKRALYQPLAVLASAVSFSVDSLQLVHPMYLFSLSEFNKLFVNAFTQCTHTDDRLRKIITTFNSLTY